MATKKYQVFVSSTFRDLVEERQDTVRNILDLNHIPAGMEMFPSADVEQLTYIKKVIDECDYYLLIIGGRYGSIDEAGISFTEREYDYAVESGKFVVAFVHGQPGSISVDKSDVKPEVAAALKTFRDKVMAGRLVQSWTNRQDLQLAVIKSLMHAFNNHPQVGWIRGNAAANDQVLEQSNKALQENAQLKSEIAAMKATLLPKVENLADLDQLFTIRYRIATQWKFETTYSDRTAKFTWRQIFLAIAKELSVAKTDIVVLTGLRTLTKESSIATPYDMNDVDLARIKAQLIALNLIEAKVGTTVSNTFAEFLSLTDAGRKAYMEGMVVKA